MAKRMPLPPEHHNDASVQTQSPAFMPGFAGVVGKIPTSARRQDNASNGVPIETTVMDAPHTPSTSEGAGFLVPGLPDEFETDIPVDAIDISPWQPRLKINEDALRRLADSIESGKQINPIVVRRVSGGRFELIGGERRWRAAMLLRRTVVRAIIKHLSDDAAAVMALTDNEAREDLTDYERARSYKGLLDMKAVASQSELARRTGVDRLFIVRCLSFFRLPVEVIPLLEENPGLLGAGYAATFATFMERNEGADSDLIIEAIHKIYSLKLDATNAINWLKGQIRARHTPALPRARQEWSADGRRLGEISIEGRKLVITCAEGVTANELMNKILSADFKQ